MPAIYRAERKLAEKTILTAGLMDHTIARYRKKRNKKGYEVMGRDI